MPIAYTTKGDILYVTFLDEGAIPDNQTLTSDWADIAGYTPRTIYAIQHSGLSQGAASFTFEASAKPVTGDDTAFPVLATIGDADSHVGAAAASMVAGSNYCVPFMRRDANTAAGGGTWNVPIERMRCIAADDGSGSGSSITVIVACEKRAGLYAKS